MRNPHPKEWTKPMCKLETPPRIYIACLAAYNAGILHGRWIDADQKPDILYSEVAGMLRASPIAAAEEYAIHDHEGFEGAPICEYTGLAEVSALARFIADNGALGGALVSYFGDLDEAKRAIEDGYAGGYRSVADFAQELTEETTEIPETLRHYINYEAMARDLEIDDVLVIETGFEQVHVFWRNY